MKVLWISHFIPYPPKGGMLLRSYNLIKQLAAEHDVTLVALRRRDTFRGMYDDIDSAIDEAQSHLSEVCGRVVFVETAAGESKVRKIYDFIGSLLCKKSYSIEWLKNKNLYDVIKDEVSNTSFDLVHLDTVSFVDYYPLVNGTVTALNHHNIESQMMQRRADKESSTFRRLIFQREARMIRSFESAWCPKFDLNIVCSDIDAERLAEVSENSSIRVVPNGVDTEYFCEQPDSDNKSMIFVGGQSWYPNREAMEFFAEEIWPRLVSRNPGATFDLIGKDPSASLLALAKRDRRFRVHGFVDDIRPFVARASVYVCPIRDGGGTKLKILDALSMAIPIVAHPIAVEGIDVTDGEDVILATTADEFARRIEFLFESADARLKIAAAGRNLVEQKYSFNAIGADMRRLYSEACVDSVSA